MKTIWRGDGCIGPHQEHCSPRDYDYELIIEVPWRLERLQPDSLTESRISELATQNVRRLVKEIFEKQRLREDRK